MRIFILHATNAGLDFFKFKYTREERAVKRGPVVGTAQLDWSGYADDIVLYLLFFTNATSPFQLCFQTI